MKNPFFDYNLPLQVWPQREEDDATETGTVVGTSILNYMPRRESCCRMDIDEDTLNGQTREEFFEQAAQILENLARQLRAAGKDQTLLVYYPDKGYVEPAPSERTTR